MEDRDQFVDELLDSALAQQRSAEPRPGLEGRILERIRAARSMRVSSRKRRIIGPAVAAAIVVVAAAIYWARRPQSPALQRPQAGNLVPAPGSRGTVTASSRTAPKKTTAAIVPESKRIVHRAKKSPRHVEAHQWPSQFPTPRPLSPEEKALVQYVRDTPPKVLARPVLKANFAVQRVNIKPLKIAPLEIKPLAIGPAGEEIQ